MRLSLGLLGKKISQFEIMRMLRKSLAHGNMHLGGMVTDTSICTSCRCRGGGLKGVTVCTVGSEPWQGSLSDRILIAENRCAALFVSTVSPARSLCAGCRPPPLHGQGPRLACRAIPIAAPAPSSVQKIRLSSDGANQLNGSRNWWADGDGCLDAGVAAAGSRV
jgi:hypothetical protein